MQYRTYEIRLARARRTAPEENRKKGHRLRKSSFLGAPILEEGIAVVGKAVSIPKGVRIEIAIGALTHTPGEVDIKGGCIEHNLKNLLEMGKQRCGCLPAVAQFVLLPARKLCGIESRRLALSSSVLSNHWVETTHAPFCASEQTYLAREATRSERMGLAL